MKIRGTTVNTPIARHAVTDDSVVSKKPWSSMNTVDKLCPTFTETGSVVICEPVEGYPLHVVSKFDAKQSGTGDPSPDNVRTITGCDSLTLMYGMKHTVSFGQTVYGGTYDWQSGVLKIEVGCGKVKDFDWDTNGASVFSTYDLIGRTPLGGRGLLCSHYKEVADNDLYESSYCFSTSGKGVLHIIDNRFDTVDEFVANMGECQILYDLFDPIFVQLAPQEFLALGGFSILSCDTGEITVTGRTSPVAHFEDITDELTLKCGNLEFYQEALSSQLKTLPLKVITGTASKPVIIRELETGVYILSGKVRMNRNTEVLNNFNNFYFVERSETGKITYAQKLVPSLHALHRYEITDTNYVWTKTMLGDILTAIDALSKKFVNKAYLKVPTGPGDYYGQVRIVSSAPGGYPDEAVEQAGYIDINKSEAWMYMGEDPGYGYIWKRIAFDANNYTG